MKWTVVLVTVIAALAGCGHVVELQPDAPPADAEIDAPPIDAAPTSGDIDVVALGTAGGFGTPRDGLRVIVTAPDGTLLGDGTTDTLGRFTATVTAVTANVTIIDFVADDASRLDAIMQTITDVAPGDTVQFGLSRRKNVQDGSSQFQNVAFTPLTGGAHTFYTPCGQSVASGSPYGIPLQQGCHGTSIPVLVEATPAVGGPKRYVVASVPYDPTNEGTIPPLTETVDTYDLKVTALPDGIKTLSGSRSTLLEDRPVAEEVSQNINAPTATADLMGAQARGAGTRSAFSVRTSYTSSPTIQVFEQWQDDVAGTVSVSYDTLPLPTLTSVTITPHGFTWGVNGTATGDGLVAQWEGDWTAGAVSTHIEWRVVAPVTATGLELPKFPATGTYMRLDPRNATNVMPAVRSTNIAMVDASVADGYAGFRAKPDVIAGLGMDVATITSTFSRRIASTLALTVGP